MPPGIPPQKVLVLATHCPMWVCLSFRGFPSEPTMGCSPNHHLQLHSLEDRLMIHNTPLVCRHPIFSCISCSLQGSCDQKPAVPAILRHSLVDAQAEGRRRQCAGHEELHAPWPKHNVWRGCCEWRVFRCKSLILQSRKQITLQRSNCSDRGVHTVELLTASRFCKGPKVSPC